VVTDAASDEITKRIVDLTDDWILASRTTISDTLQIIGPHSG